MKISAAIVLSVLCVAAPAAFASELDPVTPVAPKVILVKTDTQNAVLKAYAVQAADPQALNTVAARVAFVDAQAKAENEITFKEVRGPSELDLEGSTQAWFFNQFWGWNGGWNTGWFYNPGWNYYYYNWSNPWFYSGFRWNFYW